MAFKFFDELTVAQGFQDLPEPMILHNPDTAPITLTLQPSQADLFSKLKSNIDVFGAINELPTMKKAATIASYATTTSGRGSGGKIKVTVTDVQGDLVDAFPTATGVVFGVNPPIGDGFQTYRPTTDGDGEGLEITMKVTGTAVSQTVEVTNLIKGTGYKSGDVLTFEDVNGGADFTYTILAADTEALFQPSAAIVDSTALGANYRVGDWLYITLTETVETVAYSYPLQFQIPATAIYETDITYVLGVGESTPFSNIRFKVGATTDILALS